MSFTLNNEQKNFTSPATVDNRILSSGARQRRHTAVAASANW